jgi:hAT family C-terminal dimerisation region
LPAVEFWAEMRSIAPNLSALGTFVLSITIQSATCERLFKSFSLFWTKKRNRLTSGRTHKLTQIRKQVMRYDEMIANEDNSTRSRLLNPQEVPKIVEIEEEASGGEDIALSDSDSDGDVDVDVDASQDVEACEDDENSPEDGRLLDGGELLRRWVATLNELDEEDDDGIDERLTQATADTDWNSISDYDDGKSHRERHPFPAINDLEKRIRQRFPQEKLHGVRAMKFNLRAFVPATDIAGSYGVSFD